QLTSEPEPGFLFQIRNHVGRAQAGDISEVKFGLLHKERPETDFQGKAVIVGVKHRNQRDLLSLGAKYLRHLICNRATKTVTTNVVGTFRLNGFYLPDITIRHLLDGA